MKLSFKENEDNIYYNNSHMSYLYKVTIDNIEYIFNGFFKDGYFVIIIDEYNITLSVNIEVKYVIFIKLKWILKKINDIDIYIIDNKDMRNYKINSYIINNRNNFNKLDTNITIDNYLHINKYKIITVIINGNDKLIDRIINFLT